VQVSRCFQRTQHTQTEAITLKVGNNLHFYFYFLFQIICVIFIYSQILRIGTAIVTNLKY